ncbi:general secretion pathway protein D [Bordetella ansorpii]|uniref:General secretion pathway protein D n=1 Tax=Bordetella ansorpii TaxID=288768 RepID=A0A157QKP7_9BORD|nr:type II secretion system secretin GspD [Bordetella ansorpii]SAI46301.1 general secretion pathway protein D [Bordetella ansorpii]
MTLKQKNKTGSGSRLPAPTALFASVLAAATALSGCAAPQDGAEGGPLLPAIADAADVPATRVTVQPSQAGDRPMTGVAPPPASPRPRRTFTPSFSEPEPLPAPRSSHAAPPTPAPTSANSPDRPSSGGKNDVMLNFVDTDIPSVLRVMARFTGRNFLVDPRVKGNLNLVSERPVSPDAAYGMLLASLRMAGFAAVDVAGGTRVVPEADAKLQSSPVVTSGAGPNPSPSAGSIVTRTFRLSYENAASLVPVLRPMIATNNPITASAGSNSLVITDYADNLDRIARIIASIDTPSSLSTAVVKIRQGIAMDIADVASQLLDAQQQGPDATQRIVVVADPRANNVVIRASSPARAKFARDLIQQLDDAQADPDNLHVVYLRNAQATHLAEVLRGVLTGDSGTSGQAGGADAAVRAALGAGGMLSGGGQAGSNGGSASSGTTRTSSSGNTASSTTGGLGSSGSSLRNANGAYAGGSSSGSGTNQTGNGQQAFSAGGVTIQADSTTNTLIINGPEPMYRSLRKVIDMLDQRRAQVLVESLIVEVTETDAAQLGIQWMAGNGRVFGGANFGGTSINTNATTGIDALPSGLNIGVMRGSINLPGIGEVLNLQLLARALQSRDGANILSTPNLLTLDNEPATIMVGQTVPFVSGQYVTTGGGGSDNPFQTVEREDIGLKLNIRPQISEGGTVKLDIYQEVSNIDNQASATLGGIVTNKRALDTSVMLDDGQIMVLGGLLQDSVTTGRDAVPLLGNIPVLGALFRYDTRQRVKTNLMVFLRPYVVRDAAQGRGLTASRYDYMRRAQGALQPAQNWALPDMGAPALPPLGVPSTRDGRIYDLRPEGVDQTLKQSPPTTVSTTDVRQAPSAGHQADTPPPVRTRLPAGVTVAADPSALYGRPDTGNINTLQFADARDSQQADLIVQRTRISGLKSYAMTGPGGSGYVLRVDVPRDPRAVDATIQVLRELGYQPELVVGQ